MQNSSEMITRSGQRVDVLDPVAESIHIEDIAYGLAGQFRYGGQSRLTVAQHCVEISLALEQNRYSLSDSLWGLLHDATEAYLGDMIRPLKRHLPRYRWIEQHMLDVIQERFALPGFEVPECVQRFDDAMLAAEWVYLYPDAEPIACKNEIMLAIGSTWSTDQAEKSFLQRFHYLTNVSTERQTIGNPSATK